MDRIDQWIIPNQIYDAHCHFFGYSTLERFASQRGYTSVEEFAKNWNFKNMTMDVPPKDPVKLADLWANEIRSKGCDKAVLFPEFNKLDEVTVAVKEYPDLFVPYIMLNPLDEKLIL